MAHRSCLLAILLFLGGCASIPVAHVASHSPPASGALGPDIALWSWNIEKGQARQWRQALKNPALLERLNQVNLLLLQEACVKHNGQLQDLGKLLQQRGFGWWVGLAFDSFWFGCGLGITTGVATAARIMPLQVTGLRSQGREFGITPKTALALTFHLKTRPGTLLVVNAHLLNFQFFSEHFYRRQLQRIVDLIAVHRGPVIFAGDLNTRTRYRSKLVRGIAAALCLKSAFKTKQGSKQGERKHPLDHIFYRGLERISAVVGDEISRDYSDHNSLYAVFSTTPVSPEECQPRPQQAEALLSDDD
ncbi:MAG: endonuclease/exonuclease/phosphatase family protein [Gammaproteobacteria bacterium]